MFKTFKARLYTIRKLVFRLLTMYITNKIIQSIHWLNWDKSKPYIPLTPARIRGIRNLNEYFKKHPEQAPNLKRKPKI